MENGCLQTDRDLCEDLEPGTQRRAGLQPQKVRHQTIHTQEKKLHRRRRLHLFLPLLPHQLSPTHSSDAQEAFGLPDCYRLHEHGRVPLLLVCLPCRELAFSQASCQPRQTLCSALKGHLHPEVPRHLEIKGVPKSQP